MTRKRIAITAAISLFVVTLAVIPMLEKLGIGRRNDEDYLRMFQEVVTIVHKSYVDKVDQKKLMTGAINGMLAALDPHSSYLPATDYSEMKVHMAGEFGGVGIELGMQNGKLMVNTPLEDTPAFRAGIQSGDCIWKINGKETEGLSINDCVSRMRGTPGTPVMLGILRDGSSPLNFRLVRAIIKTKSLKGKLLEPGYGYVAIAEFQEHTGEDFEKALRTLAADNGKPLSGLILDLRFNPGGLVDQAYRVADRFIGEGSSDGLIVTTKGKEASSQRSLTAMMGEKEPNYPMVVLINGASASASEIVAGALQDHKRAVIMGTQSFGKGSVQSIINLKNGDGLKLTTALYYTPSGRSIQAKGITPDIVVEFARKPPTTVKDKAEIREENLDGHIETPVAPQDKDGKESKDSNEIKKGKELKGKDLQVPRELKAQDMLQRDNQLSRALDLLKGVNLLKVGKQR